LETMTPVIALIINVLTISNTIIISDMHATAIVLKQNLYQS
jgi:hypothetical protein